VFGEGMEGCRRGEKTLVSVGYLKKKEGGLGSRAARGGGENKSRTVTKDKGRPQNKQGEVAGNTKRKKR